MARLAQIEAKQISPTVRRDVPRNQPLVSPDFAAPEALIFLVRLLDVTPGDRVIDPVCAAGELLTTALDVTLERYGNAPALRGIDHVSSVGQGAQGYLSLLGSPQAVLTRADSLQTLAQLEGQYTVVISNLTLTGTPPVTDPEVLRGFTLGMREGSPAPVPRKNQDRRLLLAELCVRALVPEGRGALIVPTSLLSNRTEPHVTFRRWLLAETRIAALIGLPEGIIRRMGRLIPASLVIFERRTKPLEEGLSVDPQPVYCTQIERLKGKSAGSAHAADDPHDAEGSQLADNGRSAALELRLDEIAQQLRSSSVVHSFPWLSGSGEPLAPCPTTLNDIARRADLSMEPARWTGRRSVHVPVQADLQFEVGTIIRPVERVLIARPNAIYHYVTIEKMRELLGPYAWTEVAGAALPDDACLLAAPRDVFLANRWVSAGKWMIAGPDAQDGKLVITGGCTRFEVIPGQEDRLPDLVYGLSSNAFQVGLRALAVGSGSLASISAEAIQSIWLPRVLASVTRRSICQRLTKILGTSFR